MEFVSNVDVGIGYKMIWENYEQFFILNPLIFIQAAIEAMVQFNLWFFKPFAEITFNLYRYTPTDTFFAFNIETYDEGCFGMDWRTDSLLVELRAGYWVNECVFGLGGLLFDSEVKDCDWQKYQTAKPVFSLPLLPNLDSIDSYVDYKCNQL